MNILSSYNIYPAVLTTVELFL